jgi:hypothetical protein
MPLEDLLGFIRHRPFIPFRVVLLDGASYEIHHPELVMPGARSIVIGIPADPSHPYYQRTITAALLHVSRLEPLDAPVSKGNGQV